jgi:DHA1 family bicyclomycin/chloramphenicol resistance-like MFS transporter
MWLVSQDWVDRIQVLGIIALSCGVVVLAAWMVLQRKSIGKDQQN